MADLPNREDLEAEFAKRFGAVARRHMHEFRALLGDPPDIRNVPPEFWQKMEDESNNTLLLLLLLIFEDSAEYHGWSGASMGFAALGFATLRARELSEYWVESTRDKFTAGLNKIRQDRRDQAMREQEVELVGHRGGTTTITPVNRIKPRHKPEPDEHEDIDDLLDKLFGPKRIEGFSIDGTTEAIHNGGESAIDATVGISTEDLWKCDWRHDNVCEICQPLDEQPRSVWEAVFPDGPPTPHPRCRCFIEYAKQAKPIQKSYRLKFNPSEPRDDHGRWTDGGSSERFRQDISSTRTATAADFPEHAGLQRAASAGDSESVSAIAGHLAMEQHYLGKVEQMQKEGNEEAAGAYQHLANQHRDWANEISERADQKREESDSINIPQVEYPDAKLPVAEELPFKPPGSHAKPETDDGVDVAGNPASNDRIKQLFGEDWTPEHVASLVGAPAGTRVTFSTGLSNSVLGVYVGSPNKLTAIRKFSIQDGKLICNNELFVVAKKHRGSGIGGKMLASQIENMRQAGVSSLNTYAARGREYVGYKVWPRMGYDADLDDDFIGKLQKSRQPAAVKAATTIQDLYKTPEGISYWEKHGDSAQMSINFDDSSSDSVKKAEAYVSKVKAKSAAKSLDDVVDSVDNIFSNDQLKILDEITSDFQTRETVKDHEC